VWNLGGDHLSDIAPNPANEKFLHLTIESVTKDIEALKMNTAISALMIYSNYLQTFVATKEVPKAVFVPFLQLLAPFAPHIASEMAERDGISIDELGTWPKFDPSKIVSETVTIAVQINGKVRATVELSPSAGEDEALATARANGAVAKWLGEGQEKKAVYVAGKIINFVVGY
jgi:leucyl-tRNA synthetase